MNLLRYSFAILSISIFLTQNVKGQNFSGEQKTLQSGIYSAYKSKKITYKEYSKLLQEQEIIKSTILKAKADGIMTPGEKNKIHSKLIRSRNRLAKYKTNREVY